MPLARLAKMLFNSTEFIVFLVLVFAGFHLLARWRLLQVLLLLAGSYFFYASWNPYYLFLIVFTSTVDYLVGGAIFRTGDPRRRKLLLYTSLFVDLGVLALFKYYNFFAAQVASTLTAAGVPVDPVKLSVLLPVGISFFTFQSMSYTIDIYRRKLEPAGRYVDYLLFVAFFPQLVAGPIVRASTFLPQLRERLTVSREQGGLALFLISCGLLKKVCIADYLAVNLVDRVFSRPEWFSSVECLAAVYGYALQIYCDFSGYSDVAIGAALLLGFRLPDNFNAPYRAHDLRNFWHRWHISLSTWLRDYLYIPLGGSQKGPGRTYFNLAATMLLGGLWHGAAWTFVIWGALHGGALAVTRLWQRRFGENESPPWWRRGLAIFLTFHFVCLTWIFFRSASFGDAMKMIERIGSGVWGTANLHGVVLAVLAAGFALHYFPDRWYHGVRRGFTLLPGVAQGAILAGVGVIVYFVAQTKVVPYIYFQF